ncbi:MAG TPA: hypothetical protein VFC10_11370 [Terriglobia bacterium]|jgi:heme-degrading monooxygenase HmoA|nr:hypothetical protein [Terriglobia bacterium]
MFARIVRTPLKPEARDGYSRAIETEIMPILRKFPGFTGELNMISTDSKEGVGISLWDSREHAEEYERKSYPEVLKVLERFAATKPEVRTFDVTYWTVEKVPVRKAA